MKRAGVREIAIAAGVSIGTVDRALNGRKEINPRTRERILAIAEKLGYEPNPSARALSVRRASVRIAVCIPEQIENFYAPLWQGIQDEVRRFRHAGVELEYRPVKSLQSDQTRVLRALLNSGSNGLIVTPGDPAATAPLIDEAESVHDMRVICVASDDSRSRRSSAVSVEPRMNGMLAADLMANFLPTCSRVAIVTGMLATEDHARKVEGFSQVFASTCTAGEIVDVIEGHEDHRETLRKCKDLLRRQSDLAGVYVTTANSIPVCRAVADLRLAGKLKVVATDLFPEVAPFIRNGTVAAVIHQRPYRQGQMAARLLLDHFLNFQPLPSAQYLNPAIVMRSNLALFAEAVAPRPEAPSNTV